MANRIRFSSRSERGVGAGKRTPRVRNLKTTDGIYLHKQFTDPSRRHGRSVDGTTKGDSG